MIEDIASFTRVCAYDRAGFAWSEAGPEPRTAGNLASELSDLLRTAGVDPPFVLSGHSFGGVVVQVFASQFPDEVAGLVLVDASPTSPPISPRALRTDEKPCVDAKVSGSCWRRSPHDAYADCQSRFPPQFSAGCGEATAGNDAIVSDHGVGTRGLGGKHEPSC